MIRFYAIIVLVSILGIKNNISKAQQTQQVEIPTATFVPQADAVHSCAMTLLRTVGKTGPETEKLPSLYSRAARDKSEDFLIHMLAVIYVESRFDKLAKSAADAHGLMQMTEIAVVDAVRHCNLKPVTMDNLFDTYTNIKYGSCYLSKLLDETGGDWDRALIAYNGGYVQLQKYDRGETIASETANYVLKVNRALKLCKSADAEISGQSTN